MTDAHNRHSTDEKVTRRRVLSCGIAVGLSCIAGCTAGDDNIASTSTNTSIETGTTTLTPDPNLAQVNMSQLPEKRQMVAYTEELEREVPNYYNSGLLSRHKTLRLLNKGWRRVLFEQYERARQPLGIAETSASFTRGEFDSAQSVAEENGWDDIVDATSQAKKQMEMYQEAAGLLLESVELRQGSEDETEISQGVEKQEKATGMIDEADAMEIVSIDRIRAWVDERSE